MKRFGLRPIVLMLSLAGLITSAETAMASGFQIWEQEGASFGNFHAGYAALANDASIGWYNPGGLTRIKNQQVVFGAALILTDIKYTGLVQVSTLPDDASVITAQGGTINVLPSLHYATPVNDWIGFGFSVTVPFGLKTDYRANTILRYLATLTSVKVIDISPSMGFKLTDKLSFGLGPNFQKMYGDFNSVAGVGEPEVNDTKSINKVNGTAFGYHLGALYEFNENTRAGVSYHSQVVHHLTGTSRFEGPLAADIFDGVNPVIGQRARVKMTLPSYLAVSAYHKLHPQFALMGTVTHTRWNCFKTLTLEGLAGVDQFGAASQDMTASIPQHFRNTLAFSLGGDYYLNDTFTLRGGLGYDQSPVVTKNRNVQLPDSNRYIFSLGTHIQASKTIGLDAGWTHIFIKQATIQNNSQQLGIETVLTDGSVNGGADAYGFQITWDIL